MSNSLMFYRDAGLTTPATLLMAAQSDDGAAPAVDQVVYVGSVVAGNKFQAASNPGVDQMLLSIGTDGAGPVLPSSAVRLALSAAGLNTATPAASLAIGLQLLSGIAHALPVYVRVDTAAIAAGLYDNLYLRIETVETSV